MKLIPGTQIFTMADFRATRVVLHLIFEAVDGNRDWAWYCAEEIIKQQPSVVGAAVVRE